MDTIDVDVDTTGLSPGAYACDVTISSNGGSGVFSVELTVVEPQPILDYSPTSYDFGNMLEGQTDTTTFDIWNAGDGTLTYSVTESCGWVAVSPTSGSSTGEMDTIDVDVDTTGLSPGAYACDVTLSSNDGTGTFPVTLTIIESDFPPTISNILAAPSTAEAGTTIRLSARITDDIGVDEAFLIITFPNATTYNISLTERVGSTYYFEQTYTLLGSYTFYFYAIDSALHGTQSGEQSFQVQDTIPPTLMDIGVAPKPAEPQMPINITVTITDIIGVDEVYVDIKFPDGSSENHSIIDNMISNNIYYFIDTYTLLGMYNFTIYAVDTSGNGNTSTQQSFTVEDLNPPAVTVTYPTGGENISDDVYLEWNVTDDDTAYEDLIVSIKFSADGGVSWQSVVTNIANTGEFEWDTTDLTDGTNYLVKVQVKDASGNQGTDISPAVFTIDNTEPSLALQKPTLNSLYIFDREVMPILRAKAIIVGKITIVAEASDDTSGIDNVKFYIDNTLQHTDATDPYSWEWDETIFFMHTIKVVAYDHAGNSKQESVEVTIYNL
jgi:hypothetical protein